MADIQNLLNNILTKVFGKDVRQSIHDAIQQCYYDGKAGAIDLEARQTLESKADKTALAEEISDRKAEVAVERARIDELTKLEEGSTTGDAELQDIRVGADGITYENAGAAVRGQVSQLSSEIENLCGEVQTEMYLNLVNENINVVEGKYVGGNSGAEVDLNFMNCTDFVAVPFAMGTTIKVMASFYGASGIVFYDSNKKFVASVTPQNNATIESNLVLQEVTTIIPENVFYVRISYPADKQITDCYIKGLNTSFGKAIEDKIEENSKETSDKLTEISVENNTNIMLLKNILCIGDSTTKGVFYDTSSGLVNIKENYPYYLGKLSNVDVANVGHGGYGAKMWYNNVSGIIYANFECAIIGLGTNYGLTDTLEVDCVAENYTDYADTNTGCYCKIIESILEVNPDCIIFLAYAQTRSDTHEEGENVDLETTNSVIEKIATKYDLPLLDDRKNYKVDGYTCSDNLHFTKLGNYERAKLFMSQMNTYIDNNLNRINSIYTIE